MEIFDNLGVWIGIAVFLFLAAIGSFAAITGLWYLYESIARWIG